MTEMSCVAYFVCSVGSDDDGRYILTRLSISYRVIILLAVYFPFLSSKKSYKTDLMQALGFIDSIISVNSGSNVIIMKDMNFTRSNDNPGLSMFNNFCTNVLIRLSRFVITF